ncbi:Uncharacterized protein Rs2_37318 [Raphanus sativus]|nr:Uncharacterized protein Rs2_37318 [Raphanus sativus]
MQLTASGNFEEPLALCKLLPPEESSLRGAKESSIHTKNGSYEEAMEHFLASQVDITHVLSMYPSILLPKTTMIRCWTSLGMKHLCLEAHPAFQTIWSLPLLDIYSNLKAMQPLNLRK